MIQQLFNRAEDGLLWPWTATFGLDDELVPVGGVEESSEIVGGGAGVGLDRACDLLAAASTDTTQFNQSTSSDLS